MNISYRRSKPSDNETINELFIEMIKTVNSRMIEDGVEPYTELEKGYEDGYLDTFYVDDSRVIFVADNAEKVIGFISVVIHDNYLYLDDYCVSEKFRGCGIGSSLIKLSEEFAIEKGLDEVHLHVQTANHESREFYSRRGYGFISQEEKRILLGKKVR